MHLALKHLVNQYLSEIDSEIFARWAFGEDYRLLNNDAFLKNWNSLHGDSLILSQYGKPDVDIIKMIDLWKASRES